MEHFYHEVGHSKMECDSIHSLIERKIRKKDAYIPQQFIEYTKAARIHPMPLKAELLDHKFFKNYDKNLYCDSIRPGSTKNDPRVVDVKAYKYEGRKISYKLSHDPGESFKNLQCKVNTNFKPTEKFQPLNKQKLKLSKNKAEDICSLKDSIPAEYHFYYQETVENF